MLRQRQRYMHSFRKFSSIPRRHSRDDEPSQLKPTAHSKCVSVQPTECFRTTAHFNCFVTKSVPTLLWAASSSTVHWPSDKSESTRIDDNKIVSFSSPIARKAQFCTKLHLQLMFICVFNLSTSGKTPSFTCLVYTQPKLCAKTSWK